METNENRKTRDNNSDRPLVKVPVILPKETLDEFRLLNPETPVELVKIGGWKYPCAIYWLPEGEADSFLTMQQTEAKREQREARCNIPDGHGGFIRCPECNHCINCPRAQSFNFDNWHPTSLDLLYQVKGEEQEARDWTDDEEYAVTEPSAVNVECQDADTEIMAVLIERLTEIRPKYGRIFGEMLKGNVQPNGIARAIKVGKSQVYDDLPRVREAARKIYQNLMEN